MGLFLDGGSVDFVSPWIFWDHHHRWLGPGGSFGELFVVNRSPSWPEDVTHSTETPAALCSPPVLAIILQNRLRSSPPLEHTSAFSFKKTLHFESLGPMATFERTDKTTRETIRMACEEIKRKPRRAVHI